MPAGKRISRWTPLTLTVATSPWRASHARRNFIRPVCTADGRALSNSAEASVGGPVRIRLEGGEAREGKDAGIDFAVTLNGASSETVSVDYATADGTAKAGEDLVLDNYGTHKHEAVRQWLAARPRFQLHFTPTGASWLNLVESWFSKLTQQRLRRGTFSSVEELVAAIKDYLKHYNADPTPFVWSTSVDVILKKVGKCKVILGTHH